MSWRKKLETHLCPRRNIWVIQHRFLSTYQSEEQTLPSYVAHLWRYINECEFVSVCACHADISNIFLLAQFIRGIKDNTIREQLLQSEESDFEKIVEKALSLEASKIDSRELNSKQPPNINDVNKLHHKPPSSSHRRNRSRHRSSSRQRLRSKSKINFSQLGIENVCIRCGRDNHKASECRTNRHNLKCRSCGKTGHVSQEDSWIYIKNILLNGNAGEIHETLVAIKDSVIGSNKQKNLLISYGILPILIRICSNNDDITNKIEALIIIGSVAKGTPENVKLLIQEYQILPIIKRELTQITTNKYSLEICLSALCSIFRHFPSTISNFFDDTCTLPHFLSLTYSGSSLNIQIYVAAVLSLLCHTRRDQTDLLNACAIPNLVRLINNENVHLHVPVLRCLCRMAFENRSVSDIICVTSYQGRSLLDTLNYFISRSFSAETQLCAAKCITYIYRSGTLLSSDFRILHRTLPCLVRLCSDHFNCSIRAPAAETLSYLIEIDAELQRTAAICNHLLKSLFQLLKINNAEMKQAALKCLAALGANDEIIRKQIVDTNNLITDILENLNSWEIQVRIASVRCLHSLSRSVQQLRTTFQDHAIWEPLLGIINNDPSIEFLIIVTATLCNLLLEFSPAKIPLLNSGIIEKLSNLSDHDESSLKLNCIWALMNLAYQSEENTKTNIINTFGLRRILKIFNESNPLVILKTLGLLRNLLCHTYHIELIMTTHSKDLLDGFCIVLENNNSPEIKEQVLCILANITSMSQNDYITSNSNIMDIVCELLFNSDNKLQNAALYVINNIIQYSDGWFKNIYLDNCYKITIFKRLDELYKSFSGIQPQSDYVCRILKEIVIKCNKMYPEIFN